MASPDPDETLDPSGAVVRQPAQERIELPVYRPRRGFGRRFWLAFALGVVVAAGVVVLIVR